MVMPLNDISGKIFGRLKVLHISSMKPTKWTCLCQCGNKKITRSSSLLKGEVKSCGCLQREIASKNMSTHGMKSTPEWKTWSSMRQRCKPNSKDAKSYFQRGILVCDRWNSFENFFADMGRRPFNKSSIDRIDNNKGYSPENCRWATHIEQESNKRTTVLLDVNGVVKTQAEWARVLGTNPTTVMRRLKSGWSVVDACTKPPIPKLKKEKP